MQQRRLGRLEHRSSVVLYGAAALAEVTQDVADASIAEAVAAGINHFDVAASYGDAELRLGPWAGRLGAEAFLATKTGDRDAEGAWRSLQRSLERLQVDRVDLLQLHAVGSLAELDRVTAPGGALEAAVRAREEGLVGGIGITGHGHDAPSTHLEALRRFPFDTVLTPWNHALAQRPAFAAAFRELVAEIQRQDAGLMTIKTVARRNWPETADQQYATWYEPWDDPRLIDACVAFSLREPAITGIAAAGDVALLGRIVRAAQTADQMDEAEVEQILGTAPDYSSPFLSMPAGI